MYITSAYYCSSTKQFPSNYLTPPHMVQNTETYFDKPMLRLRLFCKNIPSTSTLAGLRTTLRARHAKYRTNRDDRKIEAMAFISYSHHYDHRLLVVNGTDRSHGTRLLLSRITVGLVSAYSKLRNETRLLNTDDITDNIRPTRIILTFRKGRFTSRVMKITDFKLSQRFSIDV
jgi:hypothetical protein